MEEKNDWIDSPSVTARRPPLRQGKATPHQIPTIIKQSTKIPHLLHVPIVFWFLFVSLINLKYLQYMKRRAGKYQHVFLFFVFLFSVITHQHRSGPSELQLHPPTPPPPFTNQEVYLYEVVNKLHSLLDINKSKYSSHWSRNKATCQQTKINSL